MSLYRRFSSEDKRNDGYYFIVTDYTDGEHEYTNYELLKLPFCDLDLARKVVRERYKTEFGEPIGLHGEIIQTRQDEENPDLFWDARESDSRNVEIYSIEMIPYRHYLTMRKYIPQLHIERNTIAKFYRYPVPPDARVNGILETM